MSKPRTLFLVGGSHAHGPNSGRALLEDTLRSQAGVDLIVADDYAELTLVGLEAYDLIISYSGYRADVEPTESQLRDLLTAVLTGTPFIALHCAALAFRNQLYYRQPLGHPAVQRDAIDLLRRAREDSLAEAGVPLNVDDSSETHSIEIIDRDHPITRGVHDFEITDRLYELGGDLERMHVLAESRGKVVLHTQPWGKGKVHYNGLGHDLAAIGNQSYLRLVVQAVGWALDSSQR